MTETLSEPRWFWLDYCGTAFSNDEPAFTFDLRLTRCYELAASAVVFGDLGDGVLIHGSICGPMSAQRIGHAWVLTGEEGEQVWEPITGKAYPREEWYAWAGAEEEHWYNRDTAVKKMHEFRHYGRWHDSPHP